MIRAQVCRALTLSLPLSSHLGVHVDNVPKAHVVCLIFTLTRPLVQTAKHMYDNAQRFGVDPHSPLMDEEAATPLLETDQDDAAMAGRNPRSGFNIPCGQGEDADSEDKVLTESDSLPQVLAATTYNRLSNDDEENRDLANPSRSWSPDTELFSSALSAFDLIMQARNSAHVDYSNTTPSFGLGYEDPVQDLTGSSWAPIQAPGYVAARSRYITDGVQDDYTGVEMQDESLPAPVPLISQAPLPELPQPDYGEPFVTLLGAEKASMEKILEPVRDELETLKKTTVESLPKYHPSTRANNHPRVLGTRLGGIAEHIRQHLAPIAEARRGAQEMRLW
jgi:hypothetical protein